MPDSVVAGPRTHLRFARMAHQWRTQVGGSSTGDSASEGRKPWIVPRVRHLGQGGGVPRLKRPSFQFYPGDWLQDTALRACCLGARGLWADMLCYMHQGTPYGHLTLPAVSEDGSKDILRPILPPVLARMVGGTSEDVGLLVAELEHAGVFSRTAEGVIFSRRMVQDEKLRETRASGGANSLNNPNVPRPKDSRKDTFRGSLGGPLLSQCRYNKVTQK
jgi:hypothetical protein